jgi:hypothetical protein
MLCLMFRSALYERPRYLTSLFTFIPIISVGIFYPKREPIIIISDLLRLRVNSLSLKNSMHFESAY